MTKNTQSGFIVPLIIAIAAILVAGGVGYGVYEKGKMGQREQADQTSATGTGTASTTMYGNVHTNAVQASSSMNVPTSVQVKTSVQATPIKSSMTSTSQPSIKIVSSNGGEVWKIGTNQTVTVDVEGDPTKVGTFISADLVDANNNHTNIYSSSQSISIGVQTFNILVQPTTSSGNYKLLVNLYKSFPMTGGASGPQLQASDLSSNYFTITN